MNDQTLPKPDWKARLIEPLITEQLLSYAQIAAIVGASRVAVAGAAHRNNITSPLTRGATTAIGSKGGTAFKARQPKNPKVNPKADRPRMSRIAPTQPLALPDDLIDKTPLRKDAWLPLPGTAPRPLHDLEQHDCKWPLGDGPFTFCGQPAATGRVYCAAHVALAYKPREDRRKAPT